MAWSLTLPPPPSLLTFHHHTTRSLFSNGVPLTRLRHRPILTLVPSAGNKDADLRVSSLQDQQRDDDDEPTPQDLQYVAQIKRVLELLRKNRDMLFGEVKLTILIEDPREVERRRLLGIEYSEGPTREDLVDALEEVNEGKIPKNRAALQVLAEELASWPNIEEEAPKKKRGKSLYAQATDTGINPEVAAKKLNIDWDSAASEIEEINIEDDTEVPPAVGYGALYLVSAFPIIIDGADLAAIAEGVFPVTKIIKAKTSNTETPHKENKMVMDARSQKESYDPSTTLAATDLHRPSSQPPKPRLPSLSLPNSTNSTPSTLTKKRLKQRIIESPCEGRMHQHDQQQEMHLRRSKSCGEGRARAPSEEFDLWWAIPNAVERDKMHQNSFSKTEAIRDNLVSGKEVETYEEEGFKCSALCLYIPGFGKGKPVKMRKEGSVVEGAAISRTVSLEKFECGSWASSALLREIEGDPMNSSYFDLPMELIKCSANDVHAPVASAFVFEKDLKGVPKTGSSTKSPQHVRFSSSSCTSKPASPASCITPRLSKAREDFTAFLEAQSA